MNDNALMADFASHHIEGYATAAVEKFGYSDEAHFAAPLVLCNQTFEDFLRNYKAGDA